MQSCATSAVNLIFNVNECESMGQVVTPYNFMGNEFNDFWAIFGENGKNVF
jgi:hypothetical protein